MATQGLWDIAMVLVWRIEADYGHFSHPATNYSSLTYPVPPKTTVMGMLGAIMGVQDYLSFNAMRYAVVVERLEGKRQFCFNGIKDALIELDPSKERNGFRKGRKQFYRELLVSPHYRIYCDLSEVGKDVRDRLLFAMEDGRAYYPLYMGVNFCLASYSFLGIAEGCSIRYDDVMVDSMVPLDVDFELEDGKSYTDVRMATRIANGREFGGFRDYLVETSGRSIRCRDVGVYEVEGSRVIWS
ncbi:CRISPR-associated protein Cas5 [Hydrogenimonas cancrithermarum]|nr:CRISPR-associated protein Cas5 [Hydrogenimonas cancrithermarum]